MAIPVVASFTFDTVTTAGDSVTMTKPASVAVGDLLILLVGNEDATASTSFPAHSGWTKAYESGDATPDAKIGMYWRIADGTEGASETISWAATGLDAGGGWYLRITGADDVAPIHLLGTAAQSAGASSLAAPSLTTTLDNCLVFTHQSGDGGDTYPFTPSGTGWPGSVPTNQELQSSTGTDNWAGCWVTRSLASFGASNACTIAMSVSDGIVLRQFAVVEAQAGITSVTPSEFDMDTASVTIAGSGFGATIGSSDVYLSPNDLLSEAGEVDITSAVNTWSATSINLDLTSLSAGELASLQTMGPGARFIIVNVGGVPATTEYFSAVTLHRPEGFQMVLGAATPGTTTSRLTGMSGTFGGGRIEETAAQNPSTTNTDVAADGNREDVWSVEAKVNSREVQYDFRVLYGGSVADTITQTPQVTIADTASVPLTGISATAAVGSLAVAVVIALTGVGGTGEVGNLAASASYTVPITGVAATGSVGTLAPTVTVPLSGVEGTGAEGSLTASISAALSGETATGAVGSVTFGIGKTLTGVEGTGAVGTLAPSLTLPITGVEGTGSVGNLTESISVALSGEEATGTPGSLTVSATLPLTGVAATGSVGSLAATISVPLTGVEGTGSVGSLAPSSADEVSLTGVAGTGSVGTLAPSLVVDVTGVEGTGAVGTLGTLQGKQLSGNEAVGSVGNLTASVSVPLTGVEGTGSEGTLAASASVTLTGEEATGAVGSLTESISVALTGEEGTGAVGTLTPSSVITIALTGVEGTSAIGSLTATIQISLSGLAATGSVGDLLAGVPPWKLVNAIDLDTGRLFKLWVDVTQASLRVITAIDLATGRLYKFMLNASQF